VLSVPVFEGDCSNSIFDQKFTERISKSCQFEKQVCMSAGFDDFDESEMFTNDCLYASDNIINYDNYVDYNNFGNYNNYNNFNEIIIRRISL
jgi:hypothetical protein